MAAQDVGFAVTIGTVETLRRSVESFNTMRDT